MHYYQHGDLLLKRDVGSIPATAKKLPTLTLLTGSNGHDHRFEKGSSAILLRDGDTLYADVAEPSQLVHDEHKPILVEPGLYRMDQVREFDPTTEEVRRVVD